MLTIVAVAQTPWERKPCSTIEGVEIHLSHLFPTLAMALTRVHVIQPSAIFRFTPEELKGIQVIEFSRPVYIKNSTDLHHHFAEVAEVLLRH